MAVDKNLFLYDLAVVAIMKNEGPYIKEWLDYHLLAGVNHFYIYDNESPDNMKKILQPYIERDIVTYTFYPGKQKQMEAYLDAVKKYKFACRYMIFLDGDEFIFPQNNKSIVEVADEILSDKPTAGGVHILWYMFGSNFQERADYSRGILERFTRHATNQHDLGKSIVNPRRINYITNPHRMNYFYDSVEINEDTLKFFPSGNYKISDKIVVNHYYWKSREEYTKKLSNGDVAFGERNRSVSNFNHDKDNEIFDEGILKYRAARLKEGGG